MLKIEIKTSSAPKQASLGPFLDLFVKAQKDPSRRTIFKREIKTSLASFEASHGPFYDIFEVSEGPKTSHSIQK